MRDGYDRLTSLYHMRFLAAMIFALHRLEVDLFTRLDFRPPVVHDFIIADNLPRRDIEALCKTLYLLFTAYGDIWDVILELHCVSRPFAEVAAVVFIVAVEIWRGKIFIRTLDIIDIQVFFLNDLDQHSGIVRIRGISTALKPFGPSLIVIRS